MKLKEQIKNLNLPFMGGFEKIGFDKCRTAVLNLISKRERNTVEIEIPEGYVITGKINLCYGSNNSLGDSLRQIVIPITKKK